MGDIVDRLRSFGSLDARPADDLRGIVLAWEAAVLIATLTEQLATERKR